MSHWMDYAYATVKEAFSTGKLEGNHPATVAAIALCHEDWEWRHPSYWNTQFAVGVFLLPEMPKLYAWRMVLNGLGGYWQWDTRNGGSYSVTSALLHLGIITQDEAENIRQFNHIELNRNCHYFLIRPALLARIVKKFDLPTTNIDIGGKEMLTEREFKQREALKMHCLNAGVNAVRTANKPGYEKALASM